MGQTPLHNRSFVFDPITGPFFVGFHWAIGETADILFQHLLLVLIGCMSLRKRKEKKNLYSCFKSSCCSFHIQKYQWFSVYSGWTLSYLGFLQVLTHFLHKEGIIAPLNREHSILKFISATKIFTVLLSITAVCRWEGNKKMQRVNNGKKGKTQMKWKLIHNI